MIKYTKKVLDNGLTLLLSNDTATSMVAVNLIYKVGAKNENPEMTGFAHLFEHLMFGGSKNVPDYDAPIQMSSGENNAFTNNDYTDYYVVLPKENIEIALWVESDRMRGLNINTKTLDVQKKVVVEEFNQRYLNKPYGDVWTLIRKMAYKEHPYRWQTIGMSPSHIESAKLEDVQQFYDTYYNPKNAILSISGDITMEEAVPLVEKWFGDIEGLDYNIAEIPNEPAQTDERRVEVERNVPVSAIYIAFKMGNRLSDEFIICDTMSDILSSGDSSRMQQNLVRKEQLFTSVDAYLTGDVEEGLFVVTGYLAKGVDMKRAEEALWKEIQVIQTELVTDYELQKVQNKFEVNTIFGELNVMNKAMNLGYYEMIGNIDYINQELDCYKKVTKERITEIAKELFVKERSSTLIYKAIEEQEEVEDDK